MNGKCDVYAYEDYYGGYTIHLAGRKRKYIDEAPPCPLEAFTDHKDNFLEEYKSRREKWNQWADSPRGSVFEDLKFPHAGESFHEATLEDFRNRLVYLREIGYTFPDYVFNTIDEELQDESS